MMAQKAPFELALKVTDHRDFASVSMPLWGAYILLVLLTAQQ
jgi:hypothetical protein